MQFALILIALSFLPLLTFIVGICGNLLTIISFSYATRKRKHGFQENWRTNTIYVQNLAFIDMVYCILMLTKWIYEISMHINQYTNDENGNNDRYEKDTMFCNIFVHLNIFLATSDKWAIVTIALMRAVAITNNRKWEALCDKKQNVICFVLIPWVISLAFRLLGPLEIFSRSTKTGVCTPEIQTKATIIKYILQFSLENTIIVFSYLYILYYMVKGSYQLKSNRTTYGDDNTRKIISRNIRATKTMAMIAFSSIFLSLPILVLILIYQANKLSDDTYSLWSMIFYNVMILQYSNNLFIYVWRKDENMLAIVELLKLLFYKRNDVNQTAITDFISLDKMDSDDVGELSETNGTNSKNEIFKQFTRC